MSLDVIAVASPRTYPPRVTAFTERFWNGLAQGEFQTTRCRDCHSLSFPPKPICPHCWSDSIEWVAVEPNGTLYAWTRIHAGPAMFEAELPYAVGIVDLAQGIRLACRLYGEESWACGMAMRLIVLRYADGPLFAAASALADQTHN